MAIPPLMRVFFALCLIIPSFVGFGQSRVEGKVYDAASGKPLAFVNVAVPGRAEGTSTDIDGRFELIVPPEADSLSFSYVGYARQVRKIPKKGELTVEMEKEARELQAVNVTPGENPAHRILRKAIANRKTNNPLALDSFAFTTYNKFIYSPHQELLDSLYAQTKDTTGVEAFLEDHHLMLLESLTKRTRLGKGSDHEEVLATRVSGLKKPHFSALATDLQPFTFYDPYVELMDKAYRNPIGPNGIDKYLFVLEDTTVHPSGDSTFMIAFEPRSGTVFNGMEGVLAIHSDGFAIRNVTAEPHRSGMNRIRIRQQYERREGQWFPEQLSFETHFSELGMVIQGKSYIRNVTFDPSGKGELARGLRLSLSKEATENVEKKLRKARVDSLTPRDRKTYHDLDSIGNEMNLDATLRRYRALQWGNLAFGPLDVPLRQVYRYNPFEGHRLGLGFRTNQRFWERFWLSGYGAYGTRDERIKYGSGVGIQLLDQDRLSFALNYREDLSEPGRHSFYRTQQEKGLSGRFRDYMAERMNAVTSYRVAFRGRPFPYTQGELYGKVLDERVLGDYRYAVLGEGVTALFDRYRFVETGLRLRYSARENWALQRGRRISMGTPMPILKGNLARGWSDVLNGDHRYWRGRLSITHEFRLPGWGKFDIKAEAGRVTGRVPASQLFFGRGGSSPEFPLLAPRAFQTMEVYEFLSDRYAFFFLDHELGELPLVGDRVRPTFTLRHGLGVGALDDPERHQRITFKTMEAGYFESGLTIGNIYRLRYAGIAYLGIGGGLFYRYGPYQRPQWSENLAWKIRLDLSL